MLKATPDHTLPVRGGRLDRYDLLYEVGRGGMGSVWAALLRGKHGFEKLVAIKTILPVYAQDARFRALLLNEARITAKIEHPNVVQTFELGEEAGALYVVMEWIEGESLDVLQQEISGAQVIPLGVALRVVADICAGLSAAHELRDEQGRPTPVIHSDISPHNILVNARGMAKLADFGLAKVHDCVIARSSAQAMPSLRGKARYMAPERVAGGIEDRRTDIWSLGVVLGDLLPSGVPASCTRLVQRATAHAREQRFATALEFGRAIEAAMDDCQLTTTVADVAAFFEPIFRERSAARRRRIERTASMDDTLDVAGDLQARTQVPPGIGPVSYAASLGHPMESTSPMSRTLLVDGVRAPVVVPAERERLAGTKTKARQRWRARWLGQLGAIVFLSVVALVAAMTVIYVLRSAM